MGRTEMARLREVSLSGSTSVSHSGRQNAQESAAIEQAIGELAATGGRPFGRYVLLDDLGRGGMAVVSRAVIAGPRGFARTVVIKRILAEYAQQASFVNMLATEARLVAMLRHPAIVQVHEFGEVDGEYFLAMEHVDGTDLLQLMKTIAGRKLKLPVGAACHLVTEVARALAYAHALTDADGRPLEIVHRDISPSNIMVTPLGEVKLLDFGIAKAAAHVRDEHTTTGTLKGKISYLSPEQADGLPVDRRSDLFALGIVFHECLTMQRLFRGQSDFETMRLIREARVAPPSLVVPEIPPELDGVVLKMLARDPNDRYASCDELLADLTPISRAVNGDGAELRAFLEKLGPVPARMIVPSLTTPGAQQAATQLPLRLTRHVESRSWWKVGPRRQLGIVAAGAAVGFAMVGLLLLLRPSTPPMPAPQEVVATQPPANAAQLARDNAMRGLASPPALQVTQPSRELPTATVTPPPAVPVELERVHLAITGTSGAEALLDGKLVGTLPLDVAVPRASGTRHLVVRAPGTKPWSRVVAADVDLSLKVSLLKLHAETPHARHSLSSVVKDPFSSP
ncbi:MAG TPA: serine/threonine-protein kinase [Polyangia bacterium]|nr:serine/threonine-protein kinase [Polyangia bacterium]